MNPILKSILKFSVPLGFGIFLIYLFFRKLSPSDIEDMKFAVTTANYWWLLFSVFFTLLSQSIRALRWKALIGATGNRITFMRSFNAISVNYLVNIGIPRAGEIARCGVLATFEGIPINKSIGTVVNERIIDMLMLLLVGFIAFLFQYTIFMDFYTGHLAEMFNPLIEWLFAHPVATGSFVLLSSLLGVFILRKLLESSNNASTRLGKVVQGFKEGILSIFKLKKPLIFIVQTLLIWICYFIMVLFAFKTIEQGNSLGAGAAISLLFFGTFGFLATPGGVGAYPLIAGYLLSLYGLEVHLGTTMGWILWVGQTFLIIIVGLFAFAMLSREKNKKPNLLHVKSKNS
ncbi:flippase-like domain-containing protein [Chitinophagales bacterium]|nr:flippase-like domain-containing protein [Chitinophagales bacterium]